MRFRLNLPQPVIPLFWGLFLLEATFGSYFAIWPLWIEELGAPIKVVGLVLGSAGFIRLFVMFPAAAIADRFGYRRTIITARTFAILGLFAAALATEWWQLFAMVIGGAIGEMVFPLIQSLVATEAGEDRIRAFALVFNVGPSVALILSPLAASLLVATYGMRAAFVFGAILSILSIYFLRQISEPARVVIEAHETAPTYRAAFRHSAVQIVTALLFRDDLRPVDGCFVHPDVPGRCARFCPVDYRRYGSVAGSRFGSLRTGSFAVASTATFTVS